MYEIQLTHTAEKHLEKIPRKGQIKIIEALEQLATDPQSGKPLQGDLKGLWTLRVWPYRIVYKIDKGIVCIVVIAIKHRQSAYKK